MIFQNLVKIYSFLNFYFCVIFNFHINLSVECCGVVLFRQHFSGVVSYWYNTTLLECLDVLDFLSYLLFTITYYVLTILNLCIFCVIIVIAFMDTCMHIVSVSMKVRTQWAWTSTLRLNRLTRLLPYKLNLRLFFHKVKYS